MTTIGRHNIAFMKSATTGTGTLTLTTAVRGFLTFALAGVVNGERLTITIRDGADTEVSIGTYTAVGTTVSRDTVLSSTNGGSKISCTGRQTVAITVAAEDITPFASYFGSSETFTNASAGGVLTLTTEWVDQAGIATLAANAVTITRKGWYHAWMNVYLICASAFNGRFLVTFNGLPYRFGYTTAMGILETYVSIGPVPINASADATALGTITIDNDLGASVDAYIEDFTILKLGNQ
jgi:hypothetical protein